MTKSTTLKFIDPRRPVDYNEAGIIRALKAGYVYASYKMDGCRLHVVVDSGGRMHLRSRAGLPFPALANTEADLNRNFNYAHLAGFTGEFEAVCLDSDGNHLPAEKTAGILARHEQVDPGTIVLHHFDLVTEEDLKSDRGITDRMARKQAMDMRMDLLYRFRIRTLTQFACTTLEKVVETYGHSRAIGCEGLIITKAGQGYVSGKKVAAGWKMKPAITASGIVTGFTEAVSKMGWPLGRIASLDVAFEDGTTGTASAGAMDHGEREDVHRYPEKYLGRLAEVTAMERYASGKLRHPNWNRWRDTPDNKGVKV